MRVRLAATVLLAALPTALPASRAVADSFSAPELLNPHSESSVVARWHFAVNDSGQGGAAEAVRAGVRFFPLSATGGLGSPLDLPIPAKGRFATPITPSLAIGEQGQVALAVTYSDETQTPDEGCVEHCGSGCCRQVALASWRLGEQPPALETIKQTLRSTLSTQLSQPPLIVGSRAVTVLWDRGESEGAEQECESEAEADETQLEEAYARFGERFHVKRLMTAANGISFIHLSVTAGGEPIASWVADGTKLFTVRGTSTGDLAHGPHARVLTGLCYDQGYAEGAGPQTALAYFSESRHNTLSKLLLTTSSDAHRFSAPRQIAVIPEGTGAQIGRRGRSLLVAWTRVFSPLGEYHLFAQRGEVAGRLGAPQYLGLGTRPHTFIDDHGRSVIIYQRPPGGEVVTVTAPTGHRFGRPHRLLPGVTACRPAEEGGAVSQNGHAVVSIECEDGDQYFVRYTP